MNECEIHEVGSNATGAKAARERLPAGSQNRGGGCALQKVDALAGLFSCRQSFQDRTPDDFLAHSANIRLTVSSEYLQKLQRLAGYYADTFCGGFFFSGRCAS